MILSLILVCVVCVCVLVRSSYDDDMGIGKSRSQNRDTGPVAWHGPSETCGIPRRSQAWNDRR